ncbi:MAG: hypothetical protein GY711_26175 [bacterium]|nr:hypothetical protein [bacterium]
MGFGTSVAIDGEIAVVGELQPSPGPCCLGAAYVYERQGNVFALRAPEQRRAWEVAERESWCYRVSLAPRSSRACATPRVAATCARGPAEVVR